MLARGGTGARMYVRHSDALSDAEDRVAVWPGLARREARSSLGAVLTGPESQVLGVEEALLDRWWFVTDAAWVWVWSLWFQGACDVGEAANQAT